jgi:hypothetical protein
MEILWMIQDEIIHIEKELYLRPIQLNDIFLKNGLKMGKRYYLEVVWN